MAEEASDIPLTAGWNFSQKCMREATLGCWLFGGLVMLGEGGFCWIGEMGCQPLTQFSCLYDPQPGTTGLCTSVQPLCFWLCLLVLSSCGLRLLGSLDDGDLYFLCLLHRTCFTSAICE